ncbi:MAG: transcriptional repressor [Phycisphaeraceae bacterium]|nr:transcriptional repressor [Phycisphaerae bacterium]MBX3391294.1 transcriptional repressor [Phycisphaeraceae bacterium]
MERQTRQRKAIRGALHQAGRPLSPTEIHALSRTRSRGLGMATVYRSIRLMVESGELVAVELPGEPPRYEAAGKHHHHHFHCRSCRRVYEVEGCPDDIDSLVPTGFSLEDHEVVLYGRCAACRR